MSRFHDVEGVEIATQLKYSVRRITDSDSPYTVAATDDVVECDTSSGAITVNLPALASSKDGLASSTTHVGRRLIIKQVDGSNAVTIDGSGSEEIDGSTTIVLSADNDAVELIAGTDDWMRTAQPPELQTADIADSAVTKAKIATDAVDETKMDMSVPITVALPFTLGNRAGVNSDGVMIGALTHTAIGDCNLEDNSAGTFADDTADINDAGANDVTVGEPMDTNDALYFGYETAPFCALVLNIGTAGAGDAVAGETIWEYSQGGDSWATLESGHELTDDSTALTAGTSTYVVSFVPPSDWAVQAVDGGTAMYHVRFRATADDVYNTTTPLLTQGWVVPLDVGQGVTCPMTGTISAADLSALTASDANDDTEILLVNVTQGTFEQLTWTAADVMDRVTGLSLAVTAFDGLAVVVIQEDGTTEFASGQVVLQLDF